MSFIRQCRQEESTMEIEALPFLDANAAAEYDSILYKKNDFYRESTDGHEKYFSTTTLDNFSCSSKSSEGSYLTADSTYSDIEMLRWADSVRDI